MDFVWDGNHNLAHKTTWWWDAMPDNDDTQTEVRNCYTGVLMLLWLWRSHRPTCVVSEWWVSLLFTLDCRILPVL
jgi:hypothetical protein